MNDLELNVQTHDLVIANGTMNLLNTEPKVARQALNINLLLFRGEWFLDLDAGIPYFQELFQKGVSKEAVDTIIQGSYQRELPHRGINIFESTLTGGVYTITNFEGTTTDGPDNQYNQSNYKLRSPKCHLKMEALQPKGFYIRENLRSEAEGSGYSNHL